MRKLIINADDLGMSAFVNSQIEECMRRGVITSSTLIANAPAFEEAVQIAKRYPHISVGVHLNVMEFAPLTNAEIFRKHGMLDEEGNFIEGAIMVVPIDDELRQAVFDEWDAQISKVEETGLTPSHCDSHQHTHAIPELQEAICRVLEKHHIQRIRRKIVPSIRLMLRYRREASVKLDKSKAMMPKRKNVIVRRFRVFVEKYRSCQWNHQMAIHYRMTDCFFSYRHFVHDHDLLNLSGPFSVIELMCHPGHLAYQKETDLLLNHKDYLDSHYQLISYLEI